MAGLIEKASDKNAPYYELTGLVKNKTHLKNPAAVIIKHLRSVRDTPRPKAEDRLAPKSVPVRIANETPLDKLADIASENEKLFRHLPSRVRQHATK